MMVHLQLSRDYQIRECLLTSDLSITDDSPILPSAVHLYKHYTPIECTNTVHVNHTDKYRVGSHVVVLPNLTLACWCCDILKRLKFQLQS